MNKSRFVAKAFAGTLATTLLVLGSFAGPADAARDTGWGVSGRDTGWGVPSKRDTGWG